MTDRAHPCRGSRRGPALALALLVALPVGTARAAPTAEFEAAIRGVDGPWVEDARASVEPRRLACDVPRWAAGNHGRRLQAALRERLRARSFYDPTFEQEVRREADCWTLTIRVDAGPRTILRQRNVRLVGEGADDEDLRKVLADGPLREGEPLSEADYETLKRALERQAVTNGYFDARFREARIDVWPAEAVADVQLVFETGARYRFGELSLEVEPDRLVDDLVARVAKWEPGAPYRLGELQALRQRLFESGYFASVELNARPEQRADGRVPVEGVVRMQPRHELQTGVGYVTDFGPRFRAGYENRHLNRVGHRASAKLELSPVLRELRGAYRLPVSGRGTPWLVLDGGFAEEETQTAFSRQISLGARRVHGGPLGTTMTEFLDLTRESYEVGSVEDLAVLLIPGTTLAYASQWQAAPLELGWKADLRVRGASAPLSTVSFLQADIRGELALPLGERARVLTRAEFGTTYAGSLTRLPPSIRYFAGGDRSIRGYALDELGPEDDNGEVVGGRHLAVGSIELERMIRGRWSLAVFLDAGGAFNDRRDPTYSGVGVGARWHSPFGPIRVDLAVPLDDVDHAIRIHLGIGSTFR